jgi:hypothetical protein
MERRTFLTGAAGLLVANKALAEPKDNIVIKTERVESIMTEAIVSAVWSLAEPEHNSSSVVVLKARNEERYLAIWTGVSEGSSILEQLQRQKSRQKSPQPSLGKKLPRPSSQDFMAELVKSVAGDIESVSISLEDDIFYADTVVVGNGKTTKVDSRPSDAINLALRFGAPFFVVFDLLKANSLNQLSAEVRENAAKQAKEMKEQTQPQK